MGKIYPPQERAIDPYASYHSNVVNRLSRIISRGENVIHGVHSLDIVVDSTSPISSVLMTKGECFKDDVYLTLDSFRIDFNEPLFYVSPPFNEQGYYYILLNYEYIKARPAPKASIQIFKPTERWLYNKQRYLFLKCVKVSFNGTSFAIESFHDYDPENPENKREYARYYLGVENTLPAEYDQYLDEGRIVYVRDQDEVYYGMSGAWQHFGAIRVVADTTLCERGELVYMGLDGKCHLALANSNATLADAIVLQVGLATNGDGKVRLYGETKEVKIEPGRTIEEGENVYLSPTHAGTVTDLIPGKFPQFIGTNISPGSSSGTCTIWLMPSRIIGEGGGTPIEGTGSWYDIYQDYMMASIYKRLTCDAFINLEMTDQINSTSLINTLDFTMSGKSGDIFFSRSLSDDFDGTNVPHCQLSFDTTGTIAFQISNNGGLYWQPVLKHVIHYFPQTILEIDSTASTTFFLNEEIVGLTSGQRGMTLPLTNDSTASIGVYDLSSPGDFLVGETVRGVSSGHTATILSLYDNKNAADIRVKALFLTDGAITDYAVIYDQDDRIYLKREEGYGTDIDTLFSDIYELPSKDNDGLPNLPTPLETSKNNILEYIGSQSDTQKIPVYGSALIIDSTANLTLAISQLDAALYVASASGETTDIKNYIGKAASGPTFPSFTSTNNLTQGNDLTAAISEIDASIALASRKFNISDGDTTPSVIYNNKQLGVLVTQNTSLTTITAFDNGIENTEIIVIFGDNNTTVQNNTLIKLNDNTDFTGGTNDTISFVFTGGIWYEKTRSVNSGAGVSGPSWMIKNSNYSAQTGDKIFLESPVASFYIQLPLNPSTGDRVDFTDLGNAQTNNIEIRRNGESIMGIAENMYIDVNNASFAMVFSNSTYGWRLVFKE